MVQEFMSIHEVMMYNDLRADILFKEEVQLLIRLEQDACADVWLKRLYEKAINEQHDIGAIPHNMIPVVMVLEHKGDQFLSFMKDYMLEMDKLNALPLQLPKETILHCYLKTYSFSEMHLDGMFKYGEDCKLPLEIFRCVNVKVLSLCSNHLTSLPADVGRLKNLERLILTNNKLTHNSVPATLTFCAKLAVLMLDENLLDALPGFLLSMSSLQTVYRHGNHNYFKTTFMWYHTYINRRIIDEVTSSSLALGPQPLRSLKFLAAQEVIGSKMNFYASPYVPIKFKDYLSEIYHLFNICGSCGAACLLPGFKVITFCNPYLGNSCVPFQHWACSMDCAEDIERPATIEQTRCSRLIDETYQDYVRRCNEFYANKRPAVCKCHYPALRRRPPEAQTSNRIIPDTEDMYPNVNVFSSRNETHRSSSQRRRSKCNIL